MQQIKKENNRKQNTKTILKKNTKRHFQDIDMNFD